MNEDKLIIELTKDPENERDNLNCVIACIESNPLSDAVREFMDTQIDECFWTVPASSSGKYHPKYSLGTGGLLRHTLAAITTACTLFPISKLVAQEDRDCVIAALIMHDSCKQGVPSTGHTVFDHPLIAAQRWREFAKTKDYLTPLSDKVEIIAECIESHMGKWNTAKYSKCVLPLPKTKLQRYVHICDYLASRKNFIIDWDPLDSMTLSD